MPYADEHTDREAPRAAVVAITMFLILVVLISFLPRTAKAADTVESLKAHISQLEITIQSLQEQLAAASSLTVGCTFARDLSNGSSGEDVRCLQYYLLNEGYFKSSGGATAYFGSVTQASVAAWQVAHGLPSTGYFGQMSRAKYYQLSTPAEGTILFK